MSQLDQLRARRHTVWAQAKTLADGAADENRAFNDTEERQWKQLNAELDAVDTRIAEIVETEQREQLAAANFDAISRRPVETGRFPSHTALSKQDKELDHAFRSAMLAKNPAPIEIYTDTPRSNYQPGIERRDLLKTTATQALPVSVYDHVVMHLVESSAVMAAGATVITTNSGEDYQVPKDTAFSSAALTSEGSAIGESDPTLAVSTLKSYKYGTFFQVSYELAQDSNSDILGYMAKQAAQSLALAFGPHLISGTGSGQPQGVITGSTVGVTGPTGTGTSLGTQSTAGQGTDLLYSLIGSLAEPYSRQPSTGFLMTNASLAICRKLKDSTGQPVAGMVGGGLNAAVSGAPSGNNVVVGYPAYVDAFMAQMANTNKSIAFGDFSRYFVRIVNGIRFERSDDFAFNQDLVSFRCVIRLDGALVDASAVKTFVNTT
jgi:HK97 family phage major capsid protein